MPQRGYPQNRTAYRYSNNHYFSSILLTPGPTLPNLESGWFPAMPAQTPQIIKNAFLINCDSFYTVTSKASSSFKRDFSENFSELKITPQHQWFTENHRGKVSSKILPRGWLSFTTTCP